MKQLRRLLQFFLISLGVFFQVSEARSVEPRVIRDNNGGWIELFLAEVENERQKGTKIIFDGYCDSACALFLSLPREQLCVTKNARFGFHRAYIPFFKRSAWSVSLSNAYTAQTYAMYPSWVQSWLKKKGGLTDKIKTMPYSYVKKYLPVCKTAT